MKSSQQIVLNLPPFFFSYPFRVSSSLVYLFTLLPSLASIKKPENGFQKRLSRFKLKTRVFQIPPILSKGNEAFISMNRTRMGEKKTFIFVPSLPVSNQTPFHCFQRKINPKEYRFQLVCGTKVLREFLHIKFCILYSNAKLF